ncbi:hypothetical protein ABFS83_05G026100 [Erythranthe nasuta]
MFASQLLRILQTIPSDAKRESCVYDSAEQDTTMKENPMLYQSQTLQREDVPPLVSFESNKEIYVRETNPPLFDAKGRGDELWRGDSTGEEITIRPLCRVSSLDEDELEDSLCSDKDLENPSTDQIRPVCRPSSFEEEEDDVDSDSESSRTNAKEKEEKEQEYPLTVEEFTDILSSESSPFISPVDLFETYDDENESEYAKPEIIVCYKEINYHVVEDLRMNMPMNDGGNNTEEASDMEVFVSDEFATSSSDNTNREEGIIFPVEEDGSEEESQDKLLGQESPALPSENPTLIDASEKRSFVDKTLPIQEFGTRSFLRSFLNSFDGDDNTNNNNITVEHLQDQEISSSEAGPKGDHVQANSLSFKSKVENGSITFNFKSPAPAPAPAGVTKPVTENIEEQSIIGSGNPSNATTTSIGEIEEEKPLKKTDDIFVFSDDFSSTSKKVDKLEMEMEMEIVTPKTIPSVAKESSSDDGVSSSGKSVNSVNSEVTLGGSNFLKRDEGETSFSAGGLITFAGPAAYSGSISHRSDGSATSGRSFAFPVLQEEWNSSPERIPKEGVGRDFRKHKGWRSGLLCCRF